MCDSLRLSHTAYGSGRLLSRQSETGVDNVGLLGGGLLSKQWGTAWGKNSGLLGTQCGTVG